MRKQLQQVQAHQAQVRVALNLAMASDTAVEAEVVRLQHLVLAERAVVAADQSAAQAADVQVAAAAQRLAALQAEGQHAHKALVDRAIDLYEHPYRDEQLLLDGVSSLDQLTTRQVLADAVQARTSDLVDAVRQQQILERAASQTLSAAKVQADARHRAAGEEYQRLQTAMASRQRVHISLQQRIHDDDAEMAQQAAVEASLEAKLNAAARQYAAQVAAAGAGVLPPPIGPVLGLVGSFGLQWPISGVVTQEFHVGGHPGIDIAAPYGTPIVASGTGVVIYASWESGYGNYTCISHGQGISTCYGHQSFIGVTVGQTVARGQFIGREGSTGDSTGPHVHFEVRVNGQVRNPRDFIPGNP